MLSDRSSSLVFAYVLAIASWRQRHKRFSPGPGSGRVRLRFLNEDKRAALEIVVEERASYRDPEDRDGDLPQLETPRHMSDNTQQTNDGPSIVQV